ncbi:MAG: tetratricopeptide repeat protein [Acidobacteriota bacterium]|nr:MAG: tetratricopeptide repeat protein [Acidobacteriota bacterium]
MELNSSFEVLDGRDDLLYLASYRCGIGIHHLVGWIGDRGRQIRSLAGREALGGFEGFADTSGNEDARFRIGEKLSVFERDGRQKRFKILGIRKESNLNVYLARDLDDFDLCCLTESSLSARDQEASDEQLVRSAALALRLADHPNFIRTISAFRFRGRLMVQTEFPLEAGKCLKGLRPNGNSAETTVNYGIQICRAMAHAQKSLPGFVHGSIRPENCFVSPEGTVRLGGFHTSRTDIKDDSGEDVRSFAATLYEILTGESAFGDERPAGKIVRPDNKIRCSDLPSVKGAPDALVQLIRESLSADSTGIFTDFSELEGELTSILREEFEKELSKPLFRVPSKEDVVRRANSLASVGLIEEALNCIDVAAERFVSDADLYAVRAVVTCCAPRLNEAVESSAIAIKSGSDRFVVLLARARVLLAQGKSEAAEKYLQRALEREPYNCVALNLLGNVYLEKGYLREAWICFDQSVKLDGSQIDPLEGLVKIDLRTGNFGKAKTKARRAIDLDPQRAESHKMLGDATRALGDHVAAVGSYKAAVACGKGERSFARAYVRSCHEMCAEKGIPSNASQLRLLIEGTRLHGKKEVGREEAARFAAGLRGLVRENRFDPCSLFFFDRILAKIARKVDRRLVRLLDRELEAIWFLIRDCESAQHVLGSLGRSFFHLGNTEKSREVFVQLLQRFGPDETAFRHIAACFELEGDLSGCLKFYKKAQQCFDSESIRANIYRVRSKLTDRKHPPNNISISRKLHSQTPLL